MVPRTASAVAIIVLLLLFAASAFAEGGRTGKDAAGLAKEVEGKIVKRANESVRVQSVGCQFSIEFATHRVTFQVPLRGSRIMASDDDAGRRVREHGQADAVTAANVMCHIPTIHSVAEVGKYRLH